MHPATLDTRSPRTLSLAREPWVLAAAISTLGLTIVFGLYPLVAEDTDMWWHLAHGRLFVEHGIPRMDPFSFTADIPLIAMEWLYDVMTYSVYRIFGDNALVYLRLTALLTDAVVLNLLIRDRMRARGIQMDVAGYAVMAWAWVAFAMMLTRPVFLVRPQIFMWSMFMGMQLAVYAHLDGRLSGRALIAVLSLMTMLWVNLHPTWLLVPGTLGILLIASLLTRQWQHARTAALAITATVVASAINPGGLDITLHPFAYMVASLYTRTLTEYQPPVLWTVHVSWIHLLLLVDGLTIVAAIRQRDLFTVLMLIGLTRQALSGQRYIPFLCFFLLPVAAAYAATVLSAVRFPVVNYRWRSIGTLAGWLAVAGAASATVLAIQARLPLQRVLDWRSYPVNAVDFILENRVPGRFFNAFEWGGWLTWALPPGRIFIDGRCFTVYSEGIYRDYLRVVFSQPGWSEVLDRYQVDIILVNKRISECTIPQALANDPKWVRIFDDEVSEVYLRATPENAALRARLAASAIRPDTATMNDADGLRALRSGQLDAARVKFERAIQREPWLAEAHFHLGMARAMGGQADSAVPEWEEAARLDPTLREVHYNLGFWSERRGDTARAIREYRAEIAINPSYENAVRGLQRLQAWP